MIDKSKEFWYGDDSDDIDEYLRLFSGDNSIEIRTIKCRSCEETVLHLIVDQDEDAIAIQCPKCNEKRILLDCAEIWEDAEPKKLDCPVCGNDSYTSKAGLLRRSDGNVRHVYVGERCEKCGVLGSCVNWEINYGPTDDLEANI